jgi:hypothetical protein
MDGSQDFLATLPGLTLGRLAGFTEVGLPRVALPDGAEMEARALVALRAVDMGREVALAWAGGEPLVVGVVQPPLRAVVADGEETVIEARERLQLRCGPASVTLFADGRIELRGTQLLSRAEGTNRVQGGAVLLN